MISCSGSKNNINKEIRSPIPLINQKAAQLAQAKGLNVLVMDDYLSVLIHDATEIEKQIQILNDKLVSIRSELTNHQNDVNTNIHEKSLTPVTKPIETAKNNIKVATTKLKSKPKKRINKTYISSTKIGVNNIRIGIHKDKTRLVLDVNGSTKHDFSFDKEAGFLTITLPKTQWATVLSKTYKFNQIGGYQAQSEGQGSMMALITSDTTTVRTSTIKKTSGKPARIIIDLIK
jgi:hypothetical protein